MNILVGNVGSTSLKSKLIRFTNQNIAELSGEANLDKIKSKDTSTFSFRLAGGEKQKKPATVYGLKNGIEYLLNWYTQTGLISDFSAIDAMGFKCVMGETNGANLLTPKILAEMKKYGFVAPAHNLPYLEAIGEFKQVLDVPMVGVFEPSFHYSVPEFRKYLGIPWEWHSLGIKKLGFHGASHRYLSAKAYHLLNRKTGRVITVHLGGSSSICAVKDGLSADIDQHFSPNSGLLQGTRIGDADVTSVLFAMDEMGLNVAETQNMLSHNSGLKSMAGIGTEDIKAIEDAAKKGNKRAQLTLDLYTDGIRKHIGAFTTVLGGVDCIIFSGGAGENSPNIRQKCMENLEYMGIVLNETRNENPTGSGALISDDKSDVKVFVIPTNEELVVAHFTKQVVEKGRDLLPWEMEFTI
jgi:acetate kinase